MTSDKIIIRDFLVRGIIGISQQERENPQDILINLEILTNLEQAGLTDNISDCVDYSVIAEKIRVCAETARRFTVEALAEDIAQICLEDSRISQVSIRIEKPEAIIYTKSVGVEIVRTRKN